MALMFDMISSPEEPPEVKASATWPMTRDTLGKMAPAAMAENVPKKSSNLSYGVM